MIATTNGVQVWVAAGPIDMRKSFDSLAEHVRAFLGHDPMCGHLFVFRNRTGERVKVLWWDRNGLALYYKRLEKGTFRFPAGEDKCLAIDSRQLVQLLAGMTVVAAPSRPGMAPGSATAPDGAAISPGVG